MSYVQQCALKISESYLCQQSYSSICRNKNLEEKLKKHVYHCIKSILVDLLEKLRGVARYRLKKIDVLCIGATRIVSSVNLFLKLRSLAMFSFSWKCLCLLRQEKNRIFMAYLRDHPVSAYAKFSENLTFFIPCVRTRG